MGWIIVLRWNIVNDISKTEGGADWEVDGKSFQLTLITLYTKYTR